MKKKTKMAYMLGGAFVGIITPILLSLPLGLIRHGTTGNGAFATVFALAYLSACFGSPIGAIVGGAIGLVWGHRKTNNNPN